jgi:TolA-binding protein
MKLIIAASVAALLLCSGSAARAQTTTILTSDPVTLVKYMTLAEREKFVMASKNAEAGITPDQLEDFKETYEKMTDSQQLQVAAKIMEKAQQAMKGIQQQQPQKPLQGNSQVKNPGAVQTSPAAINVKPQPGNTGQ